MHESRNRRKMSGVNTNLVSKKVEGVDRLYQYVKFVRLETEEAKSPFTPGNNG